MVITTQLLFVWFAVVVAAVMVNENHFRRGGHCLEFTTQYLYPSSFVVLVVVVLLLLL